MVSWRTTLSGAIASAGYLFTQVGNLIDTDESTVFDGAGVIKAVGVISTAAGILYMGWKARDNKVTSEEAGAK